MQKYSAITLGIILTATISTAFCQEGLKTTPDGLIIPPFKRVPERTLKFPLKTQRMIYTDAEISAARKKVLSDTAAKTVHDRIIKSASLWLNRPDSDIRNLMADARVPRAFDLSVKGCPVHGDKVFEYDRYPWILDPLQPFKVKCPVGKELYPSNDYEAYYQSNFKEKKNWDTKYTDDGWGWLAPDGERYWFVAYANHWTYLNAINSGIINLSRAYTLTGDKRYAHKAAVMLYRLAEIYPSMDHFTQSRYGLMTAAAGGTYNGKIVNSIWETGVARNAAEAYDLIWDSIDDDKELHKLHGKDGPQIRAFIEANLLEDIIDEYFTRKIIGNFGMHQNTLLHTILSREKVDREKYLRLLVDEPSNIAPHAGIRYALYNAVFRDGLPMESPHYNSLWINSLTTIVELLKKSGLNIYNEPRLRMLYDGQLVSAAIGKFTPAIGDSGSSLGELIGSRDAYQSAYAFYKDPRYLEWIKKVRDFEFQSFPDFGSLFRPPLPVNSSPANDDAPKPQPSRLFAGYGLGIMNNKTDKSAIALTYGFHVSHYHWDFLSFELFASGQKMMPDLGYPDQMNNYVPGIYTWSQNTVSHNTVVVDASKQNENRPGVMHNFADAEFARSIDASSPAYRQTSQYRRNLIMVDIDHAQSYTLDVFRVSGGKQHDYSLHGPPGEVLTPGGVWGEKQAGTLAGPDVKIGQIYDNKQLGKEGYKGRYNGYTGSGFQHLFNVQTLRDGNGLLQYQHTLDKNAYLRIHLLPYEKQQVFMADAYDLPVKKSHTLRYLIARRQANGNEQLNSTFVSVLEPYAGKHSILASRLLHLNTPGAVAVEVKREKAMDIIISDTSTTLKYVSQYDIKTDASHAIITIDPDGKIQRVFFDGGTFLSYGKQRFEAKPLKGMVTAVDPARQQFTLQLDNDPTLKPDEIAGRIAHFTNAYRTTVHPLRNISVKGRTLTVQTSDDILVGRLRIKDVANEVSTDTNLPFTRLYTGVTMLDKDLNAIALVKKVDGGKISLFETPAMLKKDDDVWFSNIGVGDKVEVKSVFSWSK